MLGYVANPLGSSFVDGGVGTFLSNGHLLSQPSAVDARWLKLAPDNQARIQVPTLRNVDKRPYSGFVKAYGHNGYFKSLKEIVHFYNTRDVSGAGWPSPEVAENMNTAEMGKLGLTDAEEEAIIAFLGTLSDGYRPKK